MNTIAIEVSVTPEYMADQSDVANDFYAFIYHIEVTNLSDEVMTLRQRYWKIVDAFGKVKEVSGDGVVGEEPALEPGDSFAYTSSVSLHTPWGVMGGHYTFETETGDWVKVLIHEFKLQAKITLQ